MGTTKAHDQERLMTGNMGSCRVAGKIALVAGAASGIGQATALLLAREGAAVFCADLSLEGAGATASAIEAAGGRASSGRLDVASEESWREAVERTVSLLGRLDVLVNSAGISRARPIAEMSLEEWREVMAVNLEGAFLGTKHAILAMRRTGGGSIVQISSASGLKAAPGASAYSASKAAVCMFVKAAAKECLQNGDKIRVNTVCPAGVKTPLWTEMPFFRDLVEKTGSEEASFQELAQSVPQGRFAEPEEIAQAVLYLASDESLYVTGTDLVIDGGYTV
jgi:NAD(P)-dependent dehydrogenase (short-subunit alcohol dehydrogenase family)